MTSFADHPGFFGLCNRYRDLWEGRGGLLQGEEAVMADDTVQQAIAALEELTLDAIRSADAATLIQLYHLCYQWHERIGAERARRRGPEGSGT
jgi:hypothetical protein